MCLFSSSRHLQEFEATHPAALVPLQPSTSNRECRPGEGYRVPSSTLKREGNAMEIEPTTQSHSAFGQSVDTHMVLNSDSISGEVSPRRKGVITVKECASS